MQQSALLLDRAAGACLKGPQPTRLGRGRSRCLSASLYEFSPSDIELGARLGTSKVLDLASSRAPGQQLAPLATDITSLEQLTSRQSVSQSQQQGVEARIFTGRLVGGDLAGVPVLLKVITMYHEDSTWMGIDHPSHKKIIRGPAGQTKTQPSDAYPNRAFGDADVLAANELAAHDSLQSWRGGSPCICRLLGGFMAQTGASAGEQWLVFCDDGSRTAAAYAAKAGDATARNGVVGPDNFLTAAGLGNQGRLQRRQAFVLKMMYQIMQGLAFMHSRQRLHQSLGPASVLLNTRGEVDLDELQVRIWDLAFSVDVSDEALFGGATLGDIWERGSISANNPMKRLASGLWTRAKQAGVFDARSRRNFGYADDIFAAGLLLAFLAFVALCPTGSVDGPSLQRLFTVTFGDDVDAARQYCEADDRWARAVAFLGRGNETGWSLLGAMLNSQWQLRPTADSCLNHPFLRLALGPAVDARES